MELQGQTPNSRERHFRTCKEFREAALSSQNHPCPRLLQIMQKGLSYIYSKSIPMPLELANPGTLLCRLMSYQHGMEIRYYYVHVDVLVSL